MIVRYWKLPVNRIGNSGSNCLTDPECMPHAVGTKEMAQHSGQRHDEYDVAAQRDDQRFCALAKAFQCTGRGGGYGRNHKAQTDDAQGSLADWRRFRGWR